MVGIVKLESEKDFKGLIQALDRSDSLCVNFLD